MTCGGRTAAVRALYDSGNSLTELFSGSPVAVVRRAALESVLPAEVREALRDPAAFVSGEAGAGNGGAAAAVRSRLRLVPFRSVGGDGLLPAFRPEHLTVVAENGANRDATGAYVAVCEELGRGTTTRWWAPTSPACSTRRRRNPRAFRPSPGVHLEQLAGGMA